METVKCIKLIEACSAKKYQEGLDGAIEELQSLNLRVEVSHAMCEAVKGIGYMYSAVVVGRQESSAEFSD